MKLGHARGLWRYCLWLPVKKTMKSGYILNNFCVYVQNHICIPIKRQKYNISLVSTKYFNQNQSILSWKNLGSFKKKHYTIFVDKKKILLTSAKKAPFWLYNSSHNSYYSYKILILQSLSLKTNVGVGVNLLPNGQTLPWKPHA